jgi:vacuolar-type H+-ATPase subunit C/Vma6
VIEDWGYINARVRALQSLLLSPQDVRRALACGSLEEFVTFLGATPYAAPVAVAQTTRKGIAGVEEGLRRDFQRTIDRIVRAAGGRPRELLTVALGRCELFSVRALLRGLDGRAGLEAVMGSTIPFGRLDEVALEELARQPDVKSGIDLLAQWRIPYAEALRRAFPAYRGGGDLAALETALDRSFFAEALRALDPSHAGDAVVAGCLRREIDRILLGYALRAVHHGAAEVDPAASFIPGGRTVTRPVFARLCAVRSVPDFIAAVPDPAAAACLEAGLRRYLGSGRLSELDLALHACFVRGMMRLVLRDPLSVAFTVGYLWRKANEIRNLRIIARGAYARIPRADVEALLVTAA